MLLLAITFSSCSEDSNSILEKPAKILGEWENYRVEKNEIVGTGFSDGNAIFEKQWYNQTSQFSTRNTLTFNEDYTFTNFYAEVVVATGFWNKTNNDTFSFTFNDHRWSEATETYIVNFHCDNTMSIEYLTPIPAGNHGFKDFYSINYFRNPETNECNDLVDYYVSN